MLVPEALLLLAAWAADNASLPQLLAALLSRGSEAGLRSKWIYIMWDNGSHATIAALLWLCCASVLRGVPSQAQADIGRPDALTLRISGYFRSLFTGTIVESGMLWLPPIETILECLLATASASGMDLDHFLSARALSLAAATALPRRSCAHSVWLPTALMVSEAISCGLN